jgi:DNA repair protein RadC
MSIRTWPKTERPRERLLAGGAHVLTDAELLAVLFGSGNRGGSAVELGRHLLTEFHSLRELMSADRARCLRQRGLGPARYSILQASLELARRHYREVLLDRPVLSTTEAIHAFLLAQLRDRPYEVFCCLHLDARHRLIAFEELFRGTVDGASVHPREVVRQAMSHNSASVILAHNHPSGVADPSRADELVTRRLKDALDLVDVRVIDHIVVGDGRCVSLAELGLL